MGLIMARHKIAHTENHLTPLAMEVAEPGQLIYGGNGNDTLIGGSGGDTIEGFNNHDLIFGLGGDDYLTGDHGNDTIYGGDGNDHFYSGSGRNQLYGDAGDDELNSYGSADRLHGDQGNDTLIAHDGNDTLWGGEGADSMFGGLGADIFQFKNANESGVTFATMDKIKDFEDGVDKIHLWAIDANTTRNGNQAFRLIPADDFDCQAGGLIIIERNGDTLISADLDGDRIADFTIRMAGLHTLIEEDFIF